MHRKLDSHLFQARTGQDMKVVCAQTSSKFLIPMVPQAQRTQSPLRTPFHSKPNNATMATLDVTVRESPATGPDNAKVANPGVTVHQHTLRDVASPATGPLMGFLLNFTKQDGDYLNMLRQKDHNELWKIGREFVPEPCVSDSPSKSSKTSIPKSDSSIPDESAQNEAETLKLVDGPGLQPVTKAPTVSCIRGPTPALGRPCIDTHHRSPLLARAFRASSRATSSRGRGSRSVFSRHYLEWAAVWSRSENLSSPQACTPKAAQCAFPETIFFCTPTLKSSRSAPFSLSR